MSRTKTPQQAAYARSHALARRERTMERKEARVAKYSPKVVY